MVEKRLAYRALNEIEATCSHLNNAFKKDSEDKMSALKKEKEAEEKRMGDAETEASLDVFPLT